jgi:hypothetical protein
MTIRPIKILSISLLLLGISIPAIAQTPVAYVLEVDGKWFLSSNGSNLLRPGQKLAAGGVIRIDSPSRSNRIIIANLRGEIIITRNCEVEACNRPIKLSGLPAPRSLAGVVFDAAMDLIWGAPDRYSVHRSRGDELSDGVVKLSGDKIDFRPVLKKPGRYYLRWRTVPAGSEAASKWSDSTDVILDSQSVALVTVSSFKPGLYEVNLLRSMGNGYEPTAAAWVLVCAAPAYEKCNASFQEAFELTKKWGDRVKPEAARLFLQAHLDSLARQASK